MKKTHALLAGLATVLLCAGAHAATIPFFNVQFDATAIALTSDGPVGYQTLAGPLGPEPVSLAADSVGVTDVATAGAIVGPGLLTSSADVSASGLSSAVATARFSGSFLNEGPVQLLLDFSGLNFTAGTGGASTTLFVSLTSAGVTLFEDFVQGPWQFDYAALPGSTSVLGLTLASEVNAAFLGAGPGNASSFGSVSIMGSVPEASTWLLFTLGLGGLLVVRQRAAGLHTGQG